MGYAKYTIAPDGMILKDGHVMFPQDVAKDLNRKSFLEEKHVEANEFIGDIAKLLGEDDLGYDGKSWTIDDFKDAIQEVREDQENKTKKEKTQPCPACGKPLITPKEYFPAVEKMKEEISKYREVIIKDYEIDKYSKIGCCPQCGKYKGDHKHICPECREDNKISNERIKKYLKDGHTDHCARRIVWGDGECECGRGL